MTTILTLELEPVAQARFEALRREFYPPELNRIPAHVSLFHQLPGDEATGAFLQQAAADAYAFPMEVNGLRSLGRGVAYTLASQELQRLHTHLSQVFEGALIPQDRQRFQPHIVVQNKVDSAVAKATLERLRADFEPSTAQALGLLWWEYLGGPWRLIERFPFATAPE